MGSCCIALGTISSHLWWSMIMGEKRMCDWVTLLYRRKLMEHCKPAMVEKIRTIKKKKKKDWFQDISPPPSKASGLIALVLACESAIFNFLSWNQCRLRGSSKDNIKRSLIPSTQISPAVPSHRTIDSPTSRPRNWHWNRDVTEAQGPYFGFTSLRIRT